MNDTTDWQRAESILCVRLDALGDVLMTTPALRAVRRSQETRAELSHSGRRITLLTSPAAAELAPLVPEIDECIVYDAPWMKATAPRADSRPEFAMIERLRRSRFDAAIIFTVFSQNPLPAALLCMMAGIPRRLAHCRENPYQLLTDWIQEPEPNRFIRHEVRRQLDLVASVGYCTTDERLSLSVPPDAVAKLRGMLRAIGVDPENAWALVHPGASAPSRRYPPDLFAAAADLLAQDLHLPIVFSGVEAERELIEGIRTAMHAPSHSLAGRLDLAELAALISLAPVLISNNTGPAHIAAAVGTPVVDMYALTNPQHTPWGVPHRVLNFDVPCKNCFKSVCPEGHHDCLARVPPESVARAALELLASVAAQSPRLAGGASPGKPGALCSYGLRT
jgi:lipopolysaccharide heptosyltransferase II